MISDCRQFYLSMGPTEYFQKLYTFIDSQKERYKVLGELVETTKYQGGMGASTWLTLDFVFKSNGYSHQVFVQSYIPYYYIPREDLKYE